MRLHLCFGVVIALATCGIRADIVVLNETGSALLKPQPAWINSNENGGVVTTLNTRNPDSYAVAGMIFWYFNIGAYSGWSATNDAVVSAGQIWGENGPRIFRLYAIESNWVESTVTWSNFFGPDIVGAGDKAYTNWLGPELAAATVDFVNADTPTYWTIPAAEIEKLLKGERPYYGFAIVPDNYGNNMFFTRLATWKPLVIPKLTLDVYSAPPPAALTNVFRVRNEVRMPNVPGLGLNLAGYAKYSSLTMHELLPLGNFEPTLHGSLHFADAASSTPTKWVAGGGPSLAGMNVTGFRLEVLTGPAAGRSARITSMSGNAFNLDTSLPTPTENDAFAVRGVISNYFKEYYVDTNVWPSSDVPPGSHGVMSARFAPGGELTYLMDNHTSPSYIVFTGTYAYSFWGKAAQPGQSVNILAARWNWGVNTMFNRTITLTTNWVWYSFTNTVVNDPPGTNFRVTMKRSGGASDVVIDDWSLQKILPATQTAFTREAEDAITNVLTWCGRHWLGELGDSVDNFIARRDGQMPTQDKVWGNGYYPTMPEFMDMCEKLGLGAAWFALPVVLSTNEGMNLIEYLAGPTNTPYGLRRAQAGHPAPWTDSLVVFLELGNEVWHYQNGPPYARMITQLFGAMRQSPWFNADRMPLVMGGQAGNNWRADHSVPQAKYYDAYNNAGYTMGTYTSTNTDDTFGPLLAFHDSQYNGAFGYQRDLLVSDGRGKRFTIYEQNMHTTGGTAPAGVRNQMVTSVGAAVAGFDAMMTHYYESQMPCINVFAMMGNGFNYGGGVVKLWGIYADLEMEKLKRPYYHSMLGVNRAVGRDAHLLVTDTIGTPARWLQPLRNGVSGTFPYLKCYGLMQSNVYRIVLVNRDWLSNRLANVILPFSHNGAVGYTRFQPDNGSPWNTVESASFVGWVNGTITMGNSNLVDTLPPCSFTIYTVTNTDDAVWALTADRVGLGYYDRNPSGYYVDGTIVASKAWPDDDEQFFGWTGSVTGMNSSVTLTLTNNLDLTAWFEPIPEPAMAIGAGLALATLCIRRRLSK